MDCDLRLTDAGVEETKREVRRTKRVKSRLISDAERLSAAVVGLLDGMPPASSAVQQCQ